MSFAAPLVLIALLAVPALVAGYLAQERRRHRAAASLAAPALTASVTPQRPGWRRHVPPVLFALALAALIVAVAGPRYRATVPVRGAAFVLANDVSNSMTATDVRPTRLRAAQAAASRFVSELPPSAVVGQIAFARRPELLQTPTTDHALDQSAIRSLAPGGGGTAIGKAITLAVEVLSRLRTVADRRPPSAIVLLSDGGSNAGGSPVAAARQARAAHIPVDTIALGTGRGTITEHRHRDSVTGRVPVATRTLGAIAAASGGRAYTAVDAAGVKSIYARLAATFGRRTVERNLDVVLAGGALALILAAGGLSLVSFHRFI